MALFPVETRILDTWDMGTSWQTVIRKLASGDEQRQGKQVFPEYSFNCVAREQVAIVGQRAWDFYNARRGQLESFYFVVPDVLTHTDEYVATGDGSTQTLTFPCRQAASISVYLNQALQVEPSDFSFTPGAGPDGLDQLVFVSPPAAGVYVTADFYGQLVIHCRFQDAKMSRKTFNQRLFETGLALQGVRFDA